jgi:sulfite exporter TauE/SafE
MAVLPTFMGGLLLGLAGSLHCAGICGGIASATLLAARPVATARGRAGALLRIQSGRALTYTLAGAVAGTGSAGVAGLLDLAGANQLLRVAAALNLLWVGAALAGIGRGPQLLDGLARRAGVAIAGLLPQPVPAGPGVRAVALGAVWGLMPCGMVYAALLTALLAGSATGGALVMAGFALGTMPAVAAAALGAGGLITRARHGAPRLRLAAGVGLGLIGLVTLAVPPALLTEICLF